VGTAYAGPVKVSAFHFAGREVRLVRPADPDRLLEAPDVLSWNARDDYMPYWAYLWPGAFLLAEAVAREPWNENLEALEIGCGLGLAGLVALSRGLSVRFTDYDEAPLRFIARSAEENQFDPARYSTGRLDWRDLPDEQFPVILAADVLYEPRLVPLVANLIARMLAPGGLALVASPYRVAAEEFAPQLDPLGLDCTPVPIELAASELGPVRGTLYRVMHRPVERSPLPKS
jgi:predicted nicotinamide N-methyase